MKRITTFIVTLAIATLSLAQTPTGFSYQAALRDADGKILSNQSAQLRVSLMGSDETTQHYREVHTVTTNQLGLINIIIGKGTNAEGNFDQVPWADDAITMKIEIKLAGASEFIAMGTEPLLPVPYAFHAGSVKEIISIESDPDEEPIFSVKNKNGEVVFAVFQDGVEINIEEEDGKSRKAGFAIGGLSRSKDGTTEEYFRVLPHSTQINLVVDEDGGKSRKAGFAIGGLSRSKDGDDPNYFIVSPDSTRVFLDDDAGKSRKAGFAIGGLSRSKSGDNIYFEVDKDSTIVKNTTYIKEDLVVEGNITQEGDGSGGEKYGMIFDERDGNLYRTIQIGTQTWMMENLRYNPTIWDEDLDDYVSLGGTDPNVHNYEYLYGCIYRYDDIISEEICPDGWKVPTDNDWEILFKEVMGDDFDYTEGYLSQLFNKLFISNLSGIWYPHSGWADNSSELTLLPGGSFGYYDPIDGPVNDFTGTHYTGHYWAIEEKDQDGFTAIELSVAQEFTNEYLQPFQQFAWDQIMYAKSVRCMKE